MVDKYLVLKWQRKRTSVILPWIMRSKTVKPFWQFSGTEKLKMGCGKSLCEYMEKGSIVRIEEGDGK